MNNKYYTADRETGTFICGFDSLSEALEAIADYEICDKIDGIYEPDFYDVVDLNHNSVIK